MGEKWCSGAGAGRCAGGGDRSSVAGAVRLGGIWQKIPYFHVFDKEPVLLLTAQLLSPRYRSATASESSHCTATARATAELPLHAAALRISVTATVACSWQQAALTMRHRAALNCQNSLLSYSLVRNVTAPRCSCVNDELSLRLLQLL